MNKPVSFKIAKPLKEVGFDKPCLSFYFEDGQFSENVFRGTVGMDYGSPFEVEFSELLGNWNDKFLMKKNGDRCFGCDKSKGYFETFSAPTIAEVVMWFYEKHGVQLFLDYTYYDGFHYGVKWVRSNGDYGQIWRDNDGETADGGDSWAEAYELAFEYFLSNLLKQKKQ